MVKVSILKTDLGWMAFAYEGKKLLANSIPFQDKDNAMEFLRIRLLKRGIYNFSIDLKNLINEMEPSFEDLSKFHKKVLKLTMKIPRGRVLSYRELSKLINERAYRAVGRVLANNPFPIIIPCHRVIRSDGSLGGYTGGKKLKEFLLRSEGVEIVNGKIKGKYLLSSSELIHRF
ncbi:MAG: MGMT family protein [Candidatus Methanomethyliaceae archaeon]|nr:MGMT family protein [Candidatus Methanomethyliaceae archaeon]MDW7971022.1 MGMT family protein [Nitrososphaerota archaeon]